jgi:hypothetical protein
MSTFIIGLLDCVDFLINCNFIDFMKKLKTRGQQDGAL